MRAPALQSALPCANYQAEEVHAHALQTAFPSATCPAEEVREQPASKKRKAAVAPKPEASSASKKRILHATSEQSQPPLGDLVERASSLVFNIMEVLRTHPSMVDKDVSERFKIGYDVLEVVLSSPLTDARDAVVQVCGDWPVGLVSDDTNAPEMSDSCVSELSSDENSVSVAEKDANSVRAAWIDHIYDID